MPPPAAMARRRGPAAAAGLPLLLLAAAAAALAAGAGAAEWAECPKERGGVVEVDAVEQSPCPAPSGVTMRVDVTGAAAADVGGGAVDVTVYEMGFPFYTVSYDLCKWVACPLQSGPVDIGVEVEVPAHLPAAKYTVQLRGTGGGELLFCGKTELEIGGGGGGGGGAGRGSGGGAAWAAWAPARGRVSPA